MANKGGRGKRKGSSFEREVCEQFSLWVSCGERKDIFGRSDSSGARFTVGNGSAKSQAGDITYIDVDGISLIHKCCIEAKTGYGGKKKVRDKSAGIDFNGKAPIIATVQTQWDLLDCIDSKQKTPFFKEIWGQCERDSILTGRQPMLVFRRNLRSTCISIKKELYETLESFYGRPECESIVFNTWTDIIYIFPLQGFFGWIEDPSAWLNSGHGDV